MPKRKISGSLAGLIEERVELEQLNSVIPMEIYNQFIAIAEAEQISMAKTVHLAMNLFCSRLRDVPGATRDQGKHKIIQQLLSRALKTGEEREDLKGDFIGRLPTNEMNEFQAIRKRQRLKVYEATSVAALLLVEYYKENKHKRV